MLSCYVLLSQNTSSFYYLPNFIYLFDTLQMTELVAILGLEILAFPSNQFGEEEPGTNDQILDFVCTRFKAEFPIFDKVLQHIYNL